MYNNTTNDVSDDLQECDVLKIEKSVYDAIIHNCPDSPYETGGVIGSEEGVIRHFAFDNQENEYGKYRPNTEYMNHIISEWQKENISFCGIFHTHYPTCDNLSESDLEYIKVIMLALEKYTPILYFPIIIPNKRIVLHRAEIINAELVTEKEDLIITD